MKLRIHYYAQAREGAGCESEEIDYDGEARVGALWRELVRRHPALESLGEGVSFVLGMNPAGRELPIGEGDEVSILPPVSGG